VARRKQQPPPGARQTSSGRWTITFWVTEDGAKIRRSGNKILPSEPKTYATLEAAWEGYRRIADYLAQQVDREKTVRGFWERWLDEDDPRWGIKAKPRRGRETRVVYASRTRAFVERYGDRPMASLVEADVLAYQRTPEYRASQMVAVSTLLRDAERDHLRIGNPAREITREAGEAMREAREDNRVDAPSRAQVDAARAHMRRHADVYPRSLYGWFLTGTRTGMRCGEIDGMYFEFVNGTRYTVRHQLHPRSNDLRRPKWVRREKDIREVLLPEEVLAEIRYQRAQHGAESPFIWLNTFGEPWRHDARDKWWAKRVGGKSLRQICGGVSIYTATRHHWASHAVNVLGVSTYVASILFGHKDGGALITARYADRDNSSALDAIAAAYAKTPEPAAVINLGARR
jgi:hypothetical protein